MANLHLSHWDAREKVIVPGHIVNKLKSHHISVVRSIYRCLQNKFSGVVINYDEGINIPLAFQALWQAFIDANKVKLPLLIIVADDNVVLWHYHLAQLGNVSLLSTKNHKEILESTFFSIILVPQMNIKLLQPYEENRFSFVVIEDFDKIATKRLFKRLEGEFNVALTTRNFMVDRDYKTLWHILNWTNPGLFGKLNDFESFDRDHFENLRNPYGDIWYIYCSNAGDFHIEREKTETEDLENILNDWAKKNNFPSNKSPRPLRKRKANGSKGTKSKLKKHEAQESENYDKVYHEQTTQIIECIDANTSADTADNFPTNKSSMELRKHKVDDSKNTTPKFKKNEEQESENYDKVYHEQSTQIVGCSDADASANTDNVPNNASRRVLRKHKRKDLKRTKLRLKKNKVQQESESGKEVCHEQRTKIAGCMGASTSAESTNNIIKESKKLRDVSDLNYSAIMNAKETVVSPKKIVAPEFIFQPVFLKNKIPKTKPFELGDKNEKNKILNGTKNLKINNSYINQNVSEDTLSKRGEQNHFFPSLEDILTMKKKPVNISSKIPEKEETITRKNVDINTDNTKQEISSNADSINITSLEEVFRCKRKLVDNPQISKKLNVNGSSSKLSSNLAKYPELPTKNVPRNTHTNKVIHNYNKFKKINLGDEDFSSTTPKRVTMITKETQTEVHLENSQQKKDIAVSTIEHVDINNDVSSNKTKAEEVPNSDDVLREIGCEDFRGKPQNQHSDSAISIHNDQTIDDEDGSILLSVIEGKFTSQTLVRASNEIKDQRSEDNDKKGHNSGKLLESLFGDQISCSDALDKDATDETFSILNLSKLFSCDSQYSSQLRVKTIHEINKDVQNGTSQQNICESLKILYGEEDEHSKGILTENSACTIKQSSHNLISSLFG